jgi:hypothetical protein
MKYHDNGNPYPMSCGCVMIPDDSHYYHYIHPKCRLDAGKTTTIDGYVYKSWDKLPKRYQISYAHNIFTSEF